MDTSPEYVTMCRMAEEIQGAWKPAHGDCVLTDGGDRGGKQFAWWYTDDFASIPDPPTDGFLWLPRQDQLQEMMLDMRVSVGFQFMDMWKELDRYTEMEKKTHKMYYQQAATWEQLWLLYFMHQRYEKVWNGKEWTKE